MVPIFTATTLLLPPLPPPSRFIVRLCSTERINAHCLMYFYFLGDHSRKFESYLMLVRDNSSWIFACLCPKLPLISVRLSAHLASWPQTSLHCWLSCSHTVIPLFKFYQLVYVNPVIKALRCFSFYFSDDDIRNGQSTDTQNYNDIDNLEESQNTANNRENSVSNNRGLHETFKFYDNCYARERNQGKVYSITVSTLPICYVL